MSELWISDVDLAGYGFVLGSDPGHATGLALNDATAPLLGAIGPSWLGEPTQSGARKMTINGHLLTASAATLLATIDKMKALAYNGTPRIRFADRPTQEFRDARCVGFTPRAKAGDAVLSNVGCDLSIDFEIDDPLRYDVQPLGIPLSTVRAALPIGTMFSFPIVVVHGNGGTLSAITLTYRNAAGDSSQTMSLTGSLAANEYLVIDCAKIQITKYTAGAPSDAFSLWNGGGDFLVVRPADGNYELAQYPTLELSGTGTPVGVCTYARAYQ